MVTKIIGIGDGDYVCDGSDDSATIQTALNYARDNPGTTLYFLAGTYEINTRMWGYGSTTLYGPVDGSGNPTAKLKIKDECGWSNTLSETAIIVFNNVQNINVYNLEFDGNSTKQSYVSQEPYNYSTWWGHGFHQGLYFPYSTNINVHDCYFHNSLGDGVRGGNQTSYLNFYNNTCDTLGHECLFMSGGTSGGHDAKAWGNVMTMRADGALRADDTWNVHFWDNVITASASGNPGIQLGDHYGLNTNTEIDHNTITNTPGPGIWLNDLSTSDADKKIYIHDNEIKGCGRHAAMTYNCGILINRFNGTRIENNHILDCYNAGILCYNPYGTAGNNTISLKNNTITGTKETLATAAENIKAWTGYGVANALATTTINETSNTLTGNVNGDWYGDINHLGTQILLTSNMGMYAAQPSYIYTPYQDENPVSDGNQGVMLPTIDGHYTFQKFESPVVGSRALIYPAHANGTYYLLRIAENLVNGQKITVVPDGKGKYYPVLSK